MRSSCREVGSGQRRMRSSIIAEELRRSAAHGMFRSIVPLDASEYGTSRLMSREVAHRFGSSTMTARRVQMFERERRVVMQTARATVGSSSGRPAGAHETARRHGAVVPLLP